MINCVVVLCPNIEIAHIAFLDFLDYLDEMYPIECSEMVDEFANIIDTYQGTRYIFCDESIQEVYKLVSDDFIWVDDFMEGIIDNFTDGFFTATVKEMNYISH